MKISGAHASICQAGPEHVVVGVPKNVQKKWNSHDREQGRSKFPTTQYMHSQSPIAKVAGNSSANKYGNTYNVTPGAVKKEKIRNPAALAYEHNHNLHRNNTGNETNQEEANFNASAPLESLQPDQNLQNAPISNQHSDQIGSASHERTASVFESSQCDMAEADQASICSSPEKPATSNQNKNETFQEVVLTLPQGSFSDINEIRSLNRVKTNNNDNESSDDDEVAACETGHPTASLDTAYQSEDSAQLGIQAIQSSILNENLERRQLEESESALTVNAIVEEILNSPTNEIDALITDSDDQRK